MVKRDYFEERSDLNMKRSWSHRIYCLCTMWIDLWKEIVGKNYKFLRDPKNSFTTKAQILVPLFFICAVLFFISTQFGTLLSKTQVVTFQKFYSYFSTNKIEMLFLPLPCIESWTLVILSFFCSKMEPAMDGGWIGGILRYIKVVGALLGIPVKQECPIVGVLFFS